jgi:hypothetical protein
MMRHQFTGLLAKTSFILAAFAGVAWAQEDVPFGPKNYEQDFQMFAPLELDLDNQPVGFKDNRGGYFFSYDKLIWSISGERVAVGDQSITREVPPIWQDRISPINPITGLPIVVGFPVDQVTGRPLNPDTGTYPYIAAGDQQQPIQRNIFAASIQDGVPNAPMALGDRYEFGYANGDTGWEISVLDGPQQRQAQTFGLNGGIQTNAFQNGLRTQLGDVYIPFDYEPGLMHGFQDMWIGEIGTGRVLPADLNGDGVLDGDGIADDIDGDSQFGPDGYNVDNESAQIPSEWPLGPNGTINPTTPDYGDLVELPTAWELVTVRNVAQTTGVEFMAMHRFNTRNWMAKHANNVVELRYGARFLRFEDNFVVNASGGVLGESAWNTQIDNNIVGPQVELRWYNQRGRWSAMVDSKFMFGYNTQNWDQVGFLGSDLTPGRHNHPLYLWMHSFQYGQTTDNFSPVAELRIQTSYQLARAVALKAGWTGTYVGSVRRASTVVKYRLPDMGFQDRGQQDMIANGLNLGVEFNY